MPGTIRSTASQRPVAVAGAKRTPSIRFGNLYQKTVTSGSGPSLSVTVNSATNQIAGSYDANGNDLYNDATPSTT